METYIAYFVMTELNKIHLIKLIRAMTYLGLRDSKEFVETKIFPALEAGDRKFSLHLTALQLGRYLIAERSAAAEGYSFSKGYVLESYESVPEARYTDLTKL